MEWSTRPSAKQRSKNAYRAIWAGSNSDSHGHCLVAMQIAARTVSSPVDGHAGAGFRTGEPADGIHPRGAAEHGEPTGSKNANWSADSSSKFGFERVPHIFPSHVAQRCVFFTQPLECWPQTRTSGRAARADYQRRSPFQSPRHEALPQSPRPQPGVWRVGTG